MKNVFKKGFVVTESVVLLSALALLSGISFISFNWYQEDATNSKIKYDLSNLNWVLGILHASSGEPFTSFVADDKNKILKDNFTIQWSKLRTIDYHKKYKAGELDNSSLDWVNIVYLDPKTKKPYRIGATTLLKDKYQLAATLSDSSAYIIGNYIPRESIKIAGKVSITDKTQFEIDNTTEFGKILKWDTVFVGNTKAKVIKASADLKTITLDKNVVWTIIKLAESETEWLVGSPNDLRKPVINGSFDYIPYNKKHFVPSEEMKKDMVVEDEVKDESMPIDISRISNIMNMTAVLETYFSDEWHYPKVDWNWCLSDSEWKISDQNMSMLVKGGKAKLDPESKLVWLCKVPWSLGYHSLMQNWIEDTAFLLMTGISNAKKANLVLTKEIREELAKEKPTYEKIKELWTKPTGDENIEDLVFANLY